MQTKQTSVIIRKYAEGDYSKLLEGATLKLAQIEGSGFQEKIFDSNKSGEKVELPNGTYVLSELKPPQGYGVATPITFKVAAGKVLIKNKEGQFVENQNKEIAEPYSVTAFNDFEEIGYLSDFNNYGKFYYAKILMELIKLSTVSMLIYTHHLTHMITEQILILMLVKVKR